MKSKSESNVRDRTNGETWSRNFRRFLEARAPIPVERIPVNLVIASRNAHKCHEIRSLLPSDLRALSLRDFPAAPEVVEDAGSFNGNATKKAVELARWITAQPQALERLIGPGGGSQTIVMADDSGLEVDALGGAPGIYSARFAATEPGAIGNSPDAANNAKLLALLTDVPWDQRTARFRCVIALAPVLLPQVENQSAVCYADQIEWQTELFEGTCEGKIGFQPAGKGGFGYDPLFLPAGFEQTFAELGDEVKNRISHRAAALRKVRQRLEG